MLTIDGIGETAGRNLFDALLKHPEDPTLRQLVKTFATTGTFNKQLPRLLERYRKGEVLEAATRLDLLSKTLPMLASAAGQEAENDLARIYKEEIEKLGKHTTDLDPREARPVVEAILDGARILGPSPRGETLLQLKAMLWSAVQRTEGTKKEQWESLHSRL
jgi:hypothetical protein